MKAQFEGRETLHSSDAFGKSKLKWMWVKAVNNKTKTQHKTKQKTSSFLIVSRQGSLKPSRRRNAPVSKTGKLPFVRQLRDLPGRFSPSGGRVKGTGELRVCG